MRTLAHTVYTCDKTIEGLTFIGSPPPSPLGTSDVKPSAIRSGHTPVFSTGHRSSANLCQYCIGSRFSSLMDRRSMPLQCHGMPCHGCLLAHLFSPTLKRWAIQVSRRHGAAPHVLSVVLHEDLH